MGTVSPLFNTNSLLTTAEAVVTYNYQLLKRRIENLKTSNSQSAHKMLNNYQTLQLLYEQKMSTEFKNSNVDNESILLLFKDLSNLYDFGW